MGTAISQRNSLQRYDVRSVRTALTDRLTLTEALEVVGEIIDCYPNGPKLAGKGYIGAMAEGVLCKYPAVIARGASDRLTGVVAESEFLPSVAKLVAWLNRKTEEMRRPVDIEDHHMRIQREMMERRIEEEQREDARKKRPSLEELRAKHGPNWGLKGISDIEQQRINEVKERVARRQMEANTRMAEREWLARGEEPMYATEGMIISPELADVINEQDKRRAAIPPGDE